MEDISLSSWVFCIPHEDDYIIYFPMSRLILLGNASLVNLLYQARNGDRAALKNLGVTKRYLKDLFEPQRRPIRSTSSETLPPFAPKSISLFLTNSCTLRCSYCYARGGDNSRQMNWGTVTGVLEQVLDNVIVNNSEQMRVVFHGGGDVSASWSILKRTREYLRDLTSSLSITVKTSIGLNGILTSSQIAWIVQNIDSATVSIDGPQEIQNRQRPLSNGGPSFPIVYNTLRNFDDADFQYGIRCTVTRESTFQLEQIVRFLCNNFKAKKIKVEPMYPRGRAQDLDLQPPEAATFVDHFRRARKIAQKAGVELKYSGARLNVLSDVFCQAAGESCAVTPDGWVTSCYEVLSPSDPMADYFFYGRYNSQSKRFAIDEERRRRLFSLSVSNRPECAKCFCKWHCAGDCPVKSLYSKRYQRDKYLDRCYINRELTKDQLIDSLNLVDEGSLIPSWGCQK